MKTIHSLILLVVVILSGSCNSNKADLIIFNATIYTVDSSFAVQQAMAIKDGKILATGTNEFIQKEYSSRESVDAQGKFVYPGFIDAHAHFAGYASSLQTVNLFGTKSFSECIERINDFVSNKRLTPDAWIIGRGWDQNDWKKKEFPSNDSLNILFPDNPVFLTRIDGHAAIVNDAALSIAGINASTRMIGGEVELKKGKPTGILIDNAVDLVSRKIPVATASELAASFKEAEKNCFAKGLTTVDDCGLDHQVIQLMDSLHKSGDLKLRIYAMLSDNPANHEFIKKNGRIKTDRLNMRSMKVYADGALGSRGACLLKPYNDKANHYGFLLSNKEHFDSVAAMLMQQNFQMCTHAIGDSGNRVVLNTYAKHLLPGNDHRWRVEHAQVVHPLDLQLFRDLNIIPSVQPTHATSDMYWAGERLGKEREKTAYAYRQLLVQVGWMPLGTDFPVEDIDPLKTFYAAVVRKDASGWPENGYQQENALPRPDALRGMTIWAAKSNFEEHEKGSLEKGKFADFIMLDKDLMKVNEKEILGIKVLSTYLNGEKIFSIN